LSLEERERVSIRERVEIRKGEREREREREVYSSTSAVTKEPRKAPKDDSEKQPTLIKRERKRER
jgi:hypothetical protein